MPGERVRAWDAGTVLYDATPLVLAAIWGLVAALSTGQVLAGGRATGSEWLVMSLPIGRRATWCARLVAAVATVGVVAALSLGFALIIGRLASGEAPSDGWSLGATSGAIAILLATLGTAAVAPLLRQPFQAALAGMVLGASPFVLISWLYSVFPLAGASANVPVHPIAALPLIPAFGIVSFVVSTRGEPAGRGRIVRAVMIVTIALGMSLALFVTISMAIARLGRGIDSGWLQPAPVGDRVVGLRGNPASLTLYDAGTGDQIALMGFSTFGEPVAWRPDGERFAVIENASTLGRILEPRLTIRRATDGEIIEEMTPSGVVFDLHRMEWCGDGLLFDGWEKAPRVLRDGELTPLMPTWGDDADVEVEFVGCVDGQALIAIGESMRVFTQRANSGRAMVTGATSETRLMIVPVDRAGSARSIRDPIGFPAWASFRRLSRDGRYLVGKEGGSGAYGVVVADLQDGTRHVLDNVRIGRWGWLADGRLIWAVDGDDDSPPEIRVWRPGDEPVELEIDAPVGALATMELSPDARRVLVRASRREGDAFVTDRIAILDPATGRWTAIPGSETEDGKRWSGGRWASADSIVMESTERRGRLVRLEP